MNTHNARHLCSQLGLLSYCAILAIGTSANKATSQIVTDTTLGNENSRLIPNVNINNIPSDQIDGGAIRGSNLFHSFQQFNVGEGRAVYFVNPAGINNIITRVTGGSGSNIMGTLGVLGNGNFILINPNGVVFGANAKLDVGGSFLASTASSIKLSDGSFFSAAELQSPPLLNINVPIGLQFGQTPGQIIVRGTGHNVQDKDARTVDRTNRNVGLQVASGQTLALVGNNITLEGGNLTAAGGKIYLGGISGEALVTLNSDQGYALGYEGIQNFGDIQLFNQSSIETSGNGGGVIELRGRRIKLDDSYIRADTLGAESGGNLLVNASTSVEIIGRSTLKEPNTIGFFAEVAPGATGNGRNLIITTPDLRIEGGGLISVTTFGQGNGGNVSVSASDIVIFGKSPNGSLPVTGIQANVQKGSSGNGGNLSIEAKQLNLITAGLLQAIAAPGSIGNAGQLTISTQQLLLKDGAQISTSTASTQGGNAGMLEINAAESVELVGSSPSSTYTSGIFSQVRQNATGNAGNLRISTRRLSLREGGQIVVRTRENSTGQGGNLIVNASESVQVEGKSADGQFISTLGGDSKGKGDAGNLQIETNNLIVRDSGLITVSGQSTGNAGNLNIQANSISLDNQGSIEAAATTGDRGNITLETQQLQLRHQSSISTNATGNATGGNININANTLAALENSDITANADQSFGGRVSITSQGIFGTQFREQEDPGTSDITASSALGAQFSGTVTIQTPEINPNQGLIVLPDNFIDISGSIARTCQAEGSQFVVTGRGGLPPTPFDYLSGNTAWLDLRDPEEAAAELGQKQAYNYRENQRSPNQQFSEPETAVVEARGWKISDRGEVILTTEPPAIALYSSWWKQPECGGRGGV